MKSFQFFFFLSFYFLLDFKLRFNFWTVCKRPRAPFWGRASKFVTCVCVRISCVCVCIEARKIRKIKSFVDNLLSCCCHYKIFFAPLPVLPHTGLLGDLQVVFTNYLVCKTLSANIDFGNLYAAEGKKGEKQEKYNKTAKSTRQCSREQQQQQRAALGIDVRPKGTEIRSILFGDAQPSQVARWRHKGCFLHCIGMHSDLACNVFAASRAARDVCHMPPSCRHPQLLYLPLPLPISFSFSLSVCKALN